VTFVPHQLAGTLLLSVRFARQRQHTLSLRACCGTVTSTWTKLEACKGTPVPGSGACCCHRKHSMRPGIHPVMHRITVVLRNGASIDVLSTVPRSAPYFLREVGSSQTDMHDGTQ
jgi:hypothetical protein